jgi:hypothetical protein
MIPVIDCSCGCHLTQDGYPDAGNAHRHPNRLCSNCRDEDANTPTGKPAVKKVVDDKT